MPSAGLPDAAPVFRSRPRRFDRQPRDKWRTRKRKRNRNSCLSRDRPRESSATASGNASSNHVITKRNVPPNAGTAPTCSSLMILRIRARSLFAVQGWSGERCWMLRGCLSELDLPAEPRKFLPLASRVPERGKKKSALRNSVEVNLYATRKSSVRCAACIYIRARIISV